MENKKGGLSIVFLVIAIILIIVMGIFMYMQKTEADKQVAELEKNASELKETINNLQVKIDNISNTINSNNETNNNTNEAPKTNAIKESLTPSGFSGSSLMRVVLCNDKTVYVVNYDGVGYEENNVISKKLIAKNVEKIEYNGQGENFKSIIIKGENIEIIDNSYNWIENESQPKNDNVSNFVSNTENEKVEIPKASTNISENEEKIINYFKGIWTTDNGEKILAIDYGKRFCDINTSNNSKEYGTYTVEDGTEPTITLTYPSGKTLKLKLAQGGTNYLMSNDRKVQYVGYEGYYFGADEGDEGIFNN